jgi:adenylate cyclase
LEEAHRALAEANRLWPYDTARSHWPQDPAFQIFATQIGHFQAALRLAGERDHADEDADSRVPSDGNLHRDLAGPTPTTVPGATTLTTTALARMLDDHEPVIIDPMMYWWGRSIPGAVALRNVGLGDSITDAAQQRLRLKMQSLTRGNLATPIVAMGWNPERFDGRNLALRLVALGYTNVYWYRGGREAWEVANLPEAPIDPQDW